MKEKHRLEVIRQLCADGIPISKAVKAITAVNQQQDIKPQDYLGDEIVTECEINPFQQKGNYDL